MNNISISPDGSLREREHQMCDRAQTGEITRVVEIENPGDGRANSRAGSESSVTLEWDERSKIPKNEVRANSDNLDRRIRTTFQPHLKTMDATMPLTMMV